MIQVSYADLHEGGDHSGFGDDVQAGDLVRTGPNLYPHYTVIAIHGATAWVRDVQTGRDGLTALDRCAKINGPI